MKKKCVLLTTFLLIVCCTLIINAQQDFNNYQTLQSLGKIPTDFSSSTHNKINKELRKPSDMEYFRHLKFLANINYGIDNILNSGFVVYGDEVSNYVQKVASKILENDELLKSKLRFYTIKSNQVNAFSTDQGIIFVTTGLLSQLVSEAQLALILAHEITHYTNKHVIESFEFLEDSKKKGININGLSVYSKEKEFEADRLGLKLYHGAGYSMEEVLSTFDVLMYSYLPFDDVELPINFLNDVNLYVPSYLFPNKKYPIKASEDYDDSRSSHPNIKKRKREISIELKNFSNWGSSVFFYEKEFNTIQTVCRFESVRTCLLDAQYENALYSIFLLEKEYPNSIFLQRMKALAWFNLAIECICYKAVDVKNVEDFEGEISTLNYFILHLSREQKVTLALRQIYNLTMTKDKQILAVFDQLIQQIATFEPFVFSTFSFNNYQQALEIFNSTPIQVTDTTGHFSKYDKIKNKKTDRMSESFDSTKFHLYAISDIIQDENFTSRYLKYHSKHQENKKNTTIKSDTTKITEEEGSDTVKIENVIIVEPEVFYFGKKEEIDRIKSEDLQSLFTNSIQIAAKETNFNTIVINRATLITKGTEQYNEKSILCTYLMQIATNTLPVSHPVDYELIEAIKSKYGTSQVIFPSLAYAYRYNSNLMSNLFLLVPLYPVLIPSSVIMGRNTEVALSLMDLDKMYISSYISESFKTKPKQIYLAAFMFRHFNQIRQMK